MEPSVSETDVVAVYPAGFLYMNPPDETELILGYSAITKEAIREGIGRLRKALDGLPRAGVGCATKSRSVLH